MSKDLQTFDFRVIFNKCKTISKTSISKYTEIGSPCRAPLSNLRYFLVFSPLMMQDS